MFNFHNYVHLRYAVLINVVAALIPATTVKGRAHDPLLQAAWWKADVHSAVLVVALAAILGSVLVFAATRKDLRQWWVFWGCGIFVGDFPATFYWLAAPAAAGLPLTEMYTTGTCCGVIAGVVLNVILGSRKPVSPRDSGLTIPALLMREWRGQNARVLPGVGADSVRNAFAKAGVKVSADVVALYQAIGGMQVPDSRDWRVWPLAEVEAQQRAGAEFGAKFSDYLAGCWSFRVRSLGLEASEVYIDYGANRSPVRVAASLQEFLEVLASEPLRVLDPGALRK